jgi:hypothetical protein
VSAKAAVEQESLGRIVDHPAVDAERLRLKSLWPEEMADGERCAFHQRYPGEREKGGYPLGFHGWPLERRNAWYCGFNLGLIERQLALAEAGNG